MNKYKLNIQLFGEGDPEPTPPTPEPKTFSQEDVNGIVAKESKAAIEKMLKDLGVEDVKSAKEGLAKFKELQNAQKSELEKSQELNANLQKELSSVQAKVLVREQEDAISSVLNELELDSKYAKTIQKLSDLSEVDLTDTEKLKEVVNKTIETYLPNAAKVDPQDFGAGKGDKKPPEPTGTFLEAWKKKNNIQ